MPITVGSIGDIIAIAQVVGKLYKALRASQGSAVEFQDLVLELSVFYGTLERLVVLWPTRPTLPDQLALVAPIVEECKTEIDGFLGRILGRYGRQLGAEVAKAKWYKEIGRKLQWSMLEAGEVGRLREKLGRANMMIQLVYSQAQGAAAELDSKVVSEKLQILSELETEAKENLKNYIIEVQKKIEEQNRVLENQNMMIEEMTTRVQGIMTTMTPMAKITFDMKDILIDVQETLHSQQSIPRSIDPWLQKALYLEDSLGYVLPVPLETICSWETLHMVLCDKFNGRPGHELVKRKRYLFQDAANGRDLSVKIQFTSAVRPGQKISMCMILFSPDGQNNICPRCGTANVAGSDQDINCTNPSCLMTYRRVTDVTEPLANDDGKGILSSVHPPESILEEIDSNIALSDLEQLSYDKNYDCSIDLFKRARLFTRWQDAEESRSGALITKLGSMSIWYAYGAAYNVEVQISGLLQRSVMAPLGIRDMDADMSHDEILQWPHKSTSIGSFTCILLCFAGTSRENARPVVHIYSKDKILRRRIVAALKKLDWLALGKSGVVVSTWYNTEFREFIIESYVDDGWDRDFAELVW